MQVNTLVIIDLIATFGSILIQPTDHMRTETVSSTADDQNGIQENFRSLFDSIVKNDPREIGSYRNILQNEASREQQAFDIIKEEFRLTRQRNAHEQRNSHKSGGNGEKVAAFKRETIYVNNEGSPYTVRTPKYDRSEEKLAQSLLNKWKENPKNPRALYDVLKRRPDTFLNISNLRVAEEDLGAKRMFSSDVGLEISLHHYGYLSIVSGRKTPDDLYTLGFADLRAEISLCVDLISEAAVEDEAVEEAFSTMEAVLKEVPPDVDRFKSFMRALDTVITSVPLRFKDWQQPAIVAALILSGLNVTNGDTKANERIIFYENLSNDTRFLFIVDDRYTNAVESWGKYYYDLVKDELKTRLARNLLVVVTTLSDAGNKSGIRDWFGMYRPFDKDAPRREYRAEELCGPWE